MNIDKKTLKIISLEFRTIANRLINCNHQTGMGLMKQFLDYIEGNDIIHEYIIGFVKSDDFEPVERRTCFTSIGDNKQEEISFVYQYIRYAVENFNNIYYDMAMGYAREANDAVKEFCNRIILPFVNYIEGYLTEIGIKMGYDEDVKYMIHVSGGVAQVNVANDSGIVNATQNNGTCSQDLEKLIFKLMDTIPKDLSEEDRNQITESIEVIREESQSETPRKSFVNMAVKGLQMIKGGTEFAAAVAGICQFVQPLLG
ncbi:hypothetical protein bsdtb5_32190 [Anaeromicropila herbilytica]|uniref:AbiTii domain-containing protein n=2 Tax=Anaeromicropila herbilytica TaxID=2785025 RepID=A0A7R7IEB1_9FIRM|nr:hypothetical protein bsdtb5_32190 [Anaeromicropila herbilytica]